MKHCECSGWKKFEKKPEYKLMKNLLRNEGMGYDTIMICPYCGRILKEVEEVKK